MEPKPRRPILPPRSSSTPPPTARAAELVQRLEILNEERKEIIRELVMSAFQELLGDKPGPLERDGLIDLFLKGATLAPHISESLRPLVPNLVDFYLRENGVSK